MPERTYQTETERLRSLKEKARLGGGEKAIEKQHTRGKLTARERIEFLLDPDSFIEFNTLAEHQCYDFNMQEKKFPGDGVVTGYGTIDGRLVFIFSEDVTVLGGSVGTTHGAKICYTIDKAIMVGAPLIGLYESGGGRIHEGFTASRNVAGMFHRNTKASGVIPQISAIMGTCAGVAVYSPAITDFIFMVENTSQMFITGPGVIKAVTGEQMDIESLGGAKIHSEISGNAHFVYPNDRECLLGIKRLLGFLPLNNIENPPVVDTGDDPKRSTEDLMEIVPDDFRVPYDVKKVIYQIFDKGDFMEILPKFGQTLVVGFARLDGSTVGVVANQPLVMAGCLDINSSDKGARFIRFCDAFNIPLINLVDVPGFMPGKDQEYGGIIRHGAKMLYAYSEATVPKITLNMRKNYGGAVMAMCCKGTEVDQMFAWPIAKPVVLDTAAAVDIIFKKELTEAEDQAAEREKRIRDYDYYYSNPFNPAGKMLLDDVIEPQETRARLISALQMMKTKVEEKPRRKHGNIPL